MMNRIRLLASQRLRLHTGLPLVFSRQQMPRFMSTPSQGPMGKKDDKAMEDFNPRVPPEEVDWVARNAAVKKEETHDPQKRFVDMFRTSSPYIRAHRGSTFVLHIPGDAIDSPTFSGLMEDVALLSSLGVKLVLVLGARPQLALRLKQQNAQRRYHGDFPIIDDVTLRSAKDAAGYVRFEVESKLVRGVVNSPLSSPINVVSGNFYSAQPVGVRDGVDFGHAGEVRKIDRDKISKRLDQGDVVILTGIGYSVSGEVFKVDSETVASACAGQELTRLCF
eukprot:Colp12_sorted_trinity150504_noHs@25659